MESTMVIKVKYGDTLRRFNGDLGLDVARLRAKILGLFDLANDADMTLTYVDEDGDSVALVDDDDLLDAMKQDLKFLRIDVQMKNDKIGKSQARSSGSSTPMRSPRPQNPLPAIDTKLADMLAVVPEPLLGTLTQLSQDLASKAAGKSPVLADLVDSFSKMGKSYLNFAQQYQGGAGSSSQSVSSEIPIATSAAMEGKEQVSDLTGKTSPEVNAGNVSGVSVPLSTRGTQIGLVPLGVSDAHVKGKINSSGRVTPVSAGTSTVHSTSFAIPPPSSDTPPGTAYSSSVSIPLPSSGRPRATATATAIVSAALPGFSNSSSSAIPSSSDAPAGTVSGSMAPTGPVFSSSFDIPVGQMNAAGGIVLHPGVPPYVCPFKRGYYQNDASGGIFHKGVQCDGCGVLPITGPRYKSKVKEDYDLCSICFAENGNETDYVKMDKPAAHRHPRVSKAHKYWMGHPFAAGHGLRHCGPRDTRHKLLDSRFIVDVNVLDGSIMAPSTPFTKIWKMRNNGNLAWPQETKLVWIGGDKFSKVDSADLEISVSGVPVNGELDIAVDFISPESPGRYISYWRMASPSGTKFGQRVWVLIQVDSFLNDALYESLQGLNLNLPPESDGPKAHGVAEMDVDSAVVGSGFPAHSYINLQNVELAADGSNPGLSFSIDETMPVGGRNSDRVAPQSLGSYPAVDISAPITVKPAEPTAPQLSSISYPIIDLSESAPIQSSQGLPAVAASTSSTTTKADSVNETIEKTLLKELEDMGFKQVDRNKEVLRMNDYDIGQSVDDLCDVDEWDPMLQELEEMGFADQEMNKKLLKKNNGSIKRVVMDLIAGEKVKKLD